MHIINTLESEQALPKGVSIAIGNFDGLHKGHLALLNNAQKAAQKVQLPFGLLSFLPTPFEFFNSDAPPQRIQNPELRYEMLQALGLDYFYEIPFDENMAGLSPEGFSETILSQSLGVKHVTIGFDFRFGEGRKGHARDLKNFGKIYDFDVAIIERIASKQQKISSTHIREAIRNGDIDTANEMLGRPWKIRSEVVHGEARGKTIGFATANMYLGQAIAPKHGVYAVTLSKMDDPNATYKGVANFGRTPTTGLREPLLEVHVFDFEEDLYGKILDVSFHNFLRPEQKFDGLDALITQIDLDCQKARKALADF